MIWTLAHGAILFFQVVAAVYTLIMGLLTRRYAKLTKLSSERTFESAEKARTAYLSILDARREYRAAMDGFLNRGR